MSYEEKIARVKIALINFIKESIISRYNYCNEFHMWSYTAIKDAYISKFKDEFSQYMNNDIEEKLWFAGHNISFAVQTYINITPNYTLNKLLNFVEEFVRIQLDDFENWCEDISSAMYEETSEYEREFGSRSEDNPS